MKRKMKNKILKSIMIIIGFLAIIFGSMVDSENTKVFIISFIGFTLCMTILFLFAYANNFLKNS